MIDLRKSVAPFAGAWIEIYSYKNNNGLIPVAPFAGAWIEILSQQKLLTMYIVAPFAGAWIEIMFNTGNCASVPLSLPSRERGLKF